MRLSEVLGCHVTDADGGADHGTVVDVRLVAVPGTEGDDPVPRYRVAGLVVGRRAVGARLGLHRPDVRGPALLTALARAGDRGHAYVRWDQVRDLDVDARRLTIDGEPEDLPPLPAPGRPAEDDRQGNAPEE